MCKLILLFSLLALTGCQTHKEVIEELDKANPPRFEKLPGDILLQNGRHPNGNISGSVYRDKETGVEYLYLHSVGGPTMTRLWKKEE